MKTRLLLLLALLTFALSTSAQMLWDKTYGVPSLNQGLTRMVALANGGYLLVGNQETLNVPSVTKSLAIRTNANGDTIWSRRYIPAGWSFAVINAAAEDNDGNLILAGTGIQSFPSNYNGFILKLNPNGDTIWTKRIASPQHDGYYHVIIGNDGNYVLQGLEFGTSLIKKIDKNGSFVWSTTPVYSQTDPGFITNLCRSQNGYLVFLQVNTPHPGGGKTVNLTESGTETTSFYNFATNVSNIFVKSNQNKIVCTNIRLFEFNALGDTLWSRGYQINTQPIYTVAINPTTDGNYILLFNRFNGNDMDVGLMKVSPNGTVIKDTLLFRFGYYEWGKNIAVDANGDYVFAGHAGVSGNRNHIFLAKHRQWGQTIGLKEDLELASGIKLYPNPANERILIESEKPLSGTFRLYNLQGQLIRQETVAQMQQKVIPLQNLPSGIYLLRFKGENGRSLSRKIVKE